jgi:hypothetical protein
VNTVTYQMQFEEVVRTGFRRKLLRPRFLTSIAIIFVVGVVLLIAGDSAVYVGIFCLAYAVFAPLQLYFAIQRLIRQCAWFTAPTTLGFSDAGVTVTAPDYHTEMAWSGFRSCSQTRDHFFLFLDDGNSAVTIPKRAFSAEQLQRFLSYVTRFAA